MNHSAHAEARNIHLDEPFERYTVTIRQVAATTRYIVVAATSFDAARQVVLKRADVEGIEPSDYVGNVEEWDTYQFEVFGAERHAPWPYGACDLVQGHDVFLDEKDHETEQPATS